MANLLASSKLQQVLKKGNGTAWGAWQFLPGANLSRLLARTGVDWVLIDCEHGNIDDAAMHEAVPAIAACGVSPIVRIPDMQRWMVKRALDCGAHGIIVPLINTVEEVQQLVRAAKFPPLGERGFGSSFSMGCFEPLPGSADYVEQANETLLTIVQIETRKALEAVDEIAAVPGVDVLLVGPFDLANSLGCPILRGNVAPELHQAIARILEAAKKAGKKAGIFSGTGQQAKIYADMGFDMVNVFTDYATMAAGAVAELAQARGENKTASRPGNSY